MELYELWWRALDPCCCLAFLCWFHASFIIHFHTKQTTLSMSAMRASLSPSPLSPSFSCSVKFSLSVLFFHLLLSPSPFFPSSRIFPTYCKWLHLSLTNTLLQLPVDINSLLRCCRADSEFFPRAHIQLFLFSWFPALPLSWTESHGCVSPASLVQLSIFFFHFLLFFSVFSLANGSRICLPWSGKSASAPQQTFALAL